MPTTVPRLSPTAALLLALLAVAGLRLWRLAEVGAPDYDSVSNWQAVLSLAGGNLGKLFHHAAPGFVLLFVPVAWVTSDFQVFQLLHALLGVGSIGLFGRFVGRAAQLGPGGTAAVVLLAGSSLLLTSAGRDFGENALALGLSARLLASYFERLHTHQPGALLRAAGWLAAGLCLSYKMLLLVPVLGVLEWWAADGLLKQRGTWWRALAILALPYVLLGALGRYGGLPWLRWPAMYYRAVVPAEASLAGNQSRVHVELFFYLRYLLRFEPALLLGLLLSGWVWRSRAYWRRGQPLALGPYLLVWAGCLLLGLTLLGKAPRGLLFGYAPLAALLVLSLRRLLPGRAAAGVVLLALGVNIYILQQELYAPLPTRYPQVAAWLRSHHGQRIASTVGIGLTPFLGAGQSLRMVADERELPALRRAGYQYVLLDGYWRVAGVHHFDSLRHQPPVTAWPEPQLTTPLLFLEHAEYTGLDYNQTLAAQQLAARDSLQLRLYRLGP
ncbi:MAG: hypothetical protein ACRYFX_24950 [Janthinobacterium lividum]